MQVTWYSAGALVYPPWGDIGYRFRRPTMEREDRLEALMARVVEAGGTLASPRIELPPGMGAFVHAIDSEGNRVGFHDAS